MRLPKEVLRCVMASLILVVTNAHLAALTINPAQPITHEVRLQPIIVSNDDGSDTAEFFGNTSQRAEIEGFIDDIWAQAGIDVTFLTPNTWNNTFANNGAPGSNSPRPTSDLNTIRSTGITAGVTHPDSTVINIFFVEIAAGFSSLSDNSAAGLAFVGGNGISQFVGNNLVGFGNGREVIASVVAHEIGHNLGLPHITEAENLMQSGGSPDQGERLNASQISTAVNSPLAVAVPEPATLTIAVIGLVVVGSMGWRFRRVRRQSL